MAKELLINVSEGEECRIALLDDGRLEELYMERTSSTSHVGNIYKGKVTNVEPSIQAAFVDFGLGRNGFLHISDLMPTYFGRMGDDIHETVGKKMARRDRPPIQRCLRRGDEIIVQIIKEGIGTKGPTLSTYLSIPGKILVMMPGMGKMGVSRKIEDDEERRKLRHILDGLKPPKDVGFIIRTAGVDKTKAEIERDLKYLTRLWETIEKKRTSGPAPQELYTEGDLVTRTVRDVFSSDVDRLVIDNKDVAKRVKEVIKISSPRTRNRVDLYEETIPLFHQFGIEREIELMYSRHVPLPSGGSLVIDQTEAIVAIDVNSGKNRDHGDAETTAFRVDMEAADEICRQLKLRDLGGVIICDFIDLRYERHRRELEKRLHDLLRKDRAKTKVLRMSQFGIIEMTRQRMRPSFKRSVYFDCPHCKGAGLVKTAESMSLDVMRRVAIGINDLKVARVELTINPEVAFYLQNKKRRHLVELEDRYKKRVIVKADTHIGLDEMRLDLFDLREGLVLLPELEGVQQPALPHTTQLGARPQPQQQRGGRPPGRGGPQQPRRDNRGRGRDDEMMEDRFEMDRAGERDDRDEGEEPAAREPDTEHEEIGEREDHGDRNQSDRNQGDRAQGDRNQGDRNQGDRNRQQQPPRGGGRGPDRIDNTARNQGGQNQRRDQGGPPMRRDVSGPPMRRDQSGPPMGRDQAGPGAGRGPAPLQQGNHRPNGPIVQNGPAGVGGEGPPEEGGVIGEEGTGQRRRRRRRRRRGRGRGGQGAPGEMAQANGGGQQGEPQWQDDYHATGQASPASQGNADAEAEDDDEFEGEERGEGFAAQSLNEAPSDRADREPEETPEFDEVAIDRQAREAAADEAEDRADRAMMADNAAVEEEAIETEAASSAPEKVEPEPPKSRRRAAPRGRGRKSASTAADDTAAEPKPAATSSRGGGRSTAASRAAGKAAAEKAAAEEQPAEASGDASEGETADESGEAPRRRRRRGGRGRGRGKMADDNGEATDNAAEATDAPPSEKPRTSTEGRARIATEVPPTGGKRSVGDRHLVQDTDAEPLIPDPPRRPRTYRDLDSIPEDLED